MSFNLINIYIIIWAVCPSVCLSMGNGQVEIQTTQPIPNISTFLKWEKINGFNKAKLPKVNLFQTFKNFMSLHKLVAPLVIKISKYLITLLPYSKKYYFSNLPAKHILNFWWHKHSKLSCLKISPFTSSQKPVSYLFIEA